MFKVCKLKMIIADGECVNGAMTVWKACMSSAKFALLGLTAIWCSKMAEIDFDRISQNQFAIFQGQKDHQDDTIKKVQEYIEDHFEEKISVEGLANKFAISNRNFVRRFKKATHNTPFEYIQRVKVEMSKKMFESSTLNINEVMYAVGYNDGKSFRKIFKKFTGLSPIEYRRKYNREIAFA